MSRPKSEIRAELEREQRKLVQMSLGDPGILEQSRVVDKLVVELMLTEREEQRLARAV